MADPSSRIHVMRRITLLGKSSEPESCASFARQSEAESFIKRAIEVFAVRGSTVGHWWCQHNGNLEIEYWLDFGAALGAEVDSLADQYAARASRTVNLPDAGMSVLNELARSDFKGGPHSEGLNKRGHYKVPR